MNVWLACVCTTYVPDACEGRKRASDPLELGLELAVSYHVRSGNLCKSADTLNC